MSNRDYRDLLGGGFLVCVGCFAIIYATQTLNLGTLQQMGPGMFPVAVGAILALLGVFIMIPALFREGTKLEVDIRSYVAIVGSIIAFALLVRPFGLFPAIIVMTLVASRADSKLSLIKILALAVCFSAGAILIFRIGLSLPFTAFDWPW